MLIAHIISLFSRFFSSPSPTHPTHHPEPQTPPDPTPPGGGISTPTKPPDGATGPIFGVRWSPAKWTRFTTDLYPPIHYYSRRFTIAGMPGTLMIGRKNITWHGEHPDFAFDCPLHLGIRGLISVIREMRNEIRKESGWDEM